MNRMHGFAVVVWVLLLSNTLKGQTWVPCSQGYCGILTPAGSCNSITDKTFEQATTSCPGTGCISLPGNKFACNDGTEDGGIVKETKPASNLADWYRTRSGGTHPITAMVDPVPVGVCIVSWDRIACLKTRDCVCEWNQAAQQQQCVTNETSVWDESTLIPDYVSNGTICGYGD